jgi:hypothetical protein
MCEHSVKTEAGLQWHTIPSHPGYTVENLRKFVAQVAPFARAMLQVTKKNKKYKKIKNKKIKIKILKN